MIPRFVIKNISEKTLNALLEMGYTKQVEPLPKDVLVLGTNLLQAPAPEKNPLLKVFDINALTYTMEKANMESEILELAGIQKKWTNNTIKTELVLGDSEKGKVTVTALGVMIDSCVMTIDVFKKLLDGFSKFRSPFIVSHAPTINDTRPFVTIGCADYSINDLKKILSTHSELVTPSP